MGAQPSASHPIYRTLPSACPSLLYTQPSHPIAGMSPDGGRLGPRRPAAGDGGGAGGAGDSDGGGGVGGAGGGGSAEAWIAGMAQVKACIGYTPCISAPCLCTAHSTGKTSMFCFSRGDLFLLHPMLMHCLWGITKINPPLKNKTSKFSPPYHSAELGIHSEDKHSTLQDALAHRWVLGAA